MSGFRIIWSGPKPGSVWLATAVYGDGMEGRAELWLDTTRKAYRWHVLELPPSRRIVRSGQDEFIGLARRDCEAALHLVCGEPIP